MFEEDLDLISEPARRWFGGGGVGGGKRDIKTKAAANLPIAERDPVCV